MRTRTLLPGGTRLVSKLFATVVAAALIGPLGTVSVASGATRPIAPTTVHSTRTSVPVADAIVQPSAAGAARPASIVSSTACTANACDLWAKAGTYAIPGTAASVPIWGYASTSSGTAGLPGPTLIVTAGSPVTIHLHNVDLPNPTSLSISEAAMIPDTTGVTTGGDKVYTLTAMPPGTYLYEAGLTPDGPRQAAMGLYGALIVRPASGACGVAANCYTDATTPFDDEGLLVLSEIDPAFNQATLGGTPFNLSYFAPKYWLINGKAYPQTDPIATDVGHTVLLRYVNAGLVHHSMSLLGLHEVLAAADSHLAAHPETVVADTIPAGSTVDAFTTIAASAVPAGTQYALFDGATTMAS
jgi:FtsP/CotA-like multicopper oxidase with cupredoxin domain